VPILLNNLFENYLEYTDSVKYADCDTMIEANSALWDIERGVVLNLGPEGTILGGQIGQ
jgi:hypothetical protein